MRIGRLPLKKTPKLVIEWRTEGKANPDQALKCIKNAGMNTTAGSRCSVPNVATPCEQVRKLPHTRCADTLTKAIGEATTRSLV